MSTTPIKPRTGRSQFIPLKPEIQQRLNQFQTIRFVYDALCAEYPNITIGYRQFVRYVHKYTEKPSWPTV